MIPPASFCNSEDITLPLSVDELPAVLSAAADMALVLTSEGVVKHVVHGLRQQVCDWCGKPLASYLTPDSVPKLEAALLHVTDTGEMITNLELNHREGPDWSVPVRYTVRALGEMGDVLIVGRDQSSVAATQKQLVSTQLMLERGYEERRDYDARYRMLLSKSSEPFLFVSVADGRVRDLNGAAARLLGAPASDLMDADFAKEFRDRTKSELMEALVTSASDVGAPDLRLKTRRRGRELSVSGALFRAAGQRMLLCRLRTDETPGQGNDRLARNLASLFAKGKDGVVFTDLSGVIQNANDSFLDLVDAARESDVLGLSLSDFMVRSQIDLSVMLENTLTLKSGAMRIYATRLTNALGRETPVEVSVAQLEAGDQPAMGFVFRDVSWIDALRGTGPDNPAIPQIDGRFAELVGSVKLKDIVSEANEVIERICIQTAIEMTANNRAAAAEMLGLSRQSFYVKLNKYGLHGKSDD